MLRVGYIEVLILAFIVAVLLAMFLLLAFFLVRLLRSKELPVTPLETLRKRLAAGEITPEEFDELRRRLDE